MRTCSEGEATYHVTSDVVVCQEISGYNILHTRIIELETVQILEELGIVPVWYPGQLNPVF